MHRDQRQESIKQRRTHRMAARKSVARKRDQWILQDRPLAMKEMLQRDIEGAAAEHGEGENNQTAPTFSDQKKKRDQERRRGDKADGAKRRHNPRCTC